MDTDCCAASEKSRGRDGATPGWCVDGYVKVETEPCAQNIDWCKDGHCMSYMCLKSPEPPECIYEKCSAEASACEGESECNSIFSAVKVAELDRPPSRAEIQSKNNEKYSELFKCYQAQCIGEPLQCLVRQQGCTVEFNCPIGIFTGKMQDKRVDFLGEAAGVSGTWRTLHGSEALDMTHGHTCEMIPTKKTTFAPQTLPQAFTPLVSTSELSAPSSDEPGGDRDVATDDLATKLQGYQDMLDAGTIDQAAYDVLTDAAISVEAEMSSAPPSTTIAATAATVTAAAVALFF
jgi:hypothetical protein